MGLPDYFAALIVKPVILSTAKPNENIAVRAARGIFAVVLVVVVRPPVFYYRP